MPGVANLRGRPPSVAGVIDFRPSVQVILPCLDEAAALSWVLGRLPAGCSALVVDNGSTDGSPEIARALGATVVTAAQRGYGAACHAGLLAADADVVAVMDCDGSLDPAQLDRVLAPLRDPGVDLVIGARRAVSSRAFPWHLRMANREVARRIRRTTGVVLRDLGPMRAARRQPMLNLRLTDRRSGYPVQTLVKAAAAGWRIAQVDVDYRPRQGRSKVTGTPLGAWRAVRDINAVLNAAAAGTG
jgi:glycosyltransferase involved in cell wall biosynthesis